MHGSRYRSDKNYNRFSRLLSTPQTLFGVPTTRSKMEIWRDVSLLVAHGALVTGFGVFDSHTRLWWLGDIDHDHVGGIFSI